MHMSGKDERKILEVPICPTCERIPDYWVVLDGHNKCIGWLTSDEYGEANNTFHHVLFSRYNIVSDYEEFLMRMESVMCGRDFDHEFDIESDVFPKVQNAIQLYHAKEGHRKG